MTLHRAAGIVYARAPMRRLVMICVAALIGVVVGCGGSSSHRFPSNNRASIIEAARSYFVFDSTPDRGAYCASYVGLQRSDSFRVGSLTEDADRTESRCRSVWNRVSPAHTGWRDATIKRVHIDGDRAHVLVTFRMSGRLTSRNAWVGRVAPGDWRILNAAFH